ncbi:hypothetical protein FOA52_006232 [Chlamydomonas sp. UWO 241]|nr:hypothetical protein FOA52_006232 [Chlamydomonas sp. UWO 241]
MCYRWNLRNRSINLTGPLTAAELLRTLSLKVCLEVGRNQFLEDHIFRDDIDRDDSLPAAPPQEHERFLAPKLERGVEWDGKTQVLGTQPDPTTGLPHRDLLKLVEHACYTTCLEVIRRIAPPTKGGASTMDVAHYQAVWSKPFC